MYIHPAMSAAILEIVFFTIFCCSLIASEPIVGGRLISKNDIEEYSYVVSLQTKPEGSDIFQHFCGGSLISENWILSAAHCVREKNPNNIVAVIGEENLLTPNVKKYPVVKYVMDNFLQFFQQNDIALIKIKRGAKSFGRGKKTFINLPINVSEPLEPQFCEILGYGATKYGDIIPNTLYVANVTLISDEECQKSLGKVMAPKSGENSICAMGNGTDTCQGDSGGPLICSQNGKQFIYGIVNHGLNCGSFGVPSIYAIVGRYLPWIQETISSNKTKLT